MNSIKISFKRKNKEIKAFFAYFHNDSSKVPGGPPNLVEFQKFIVCPFFFLK